MDEISGMIQKIRTLAVQAANGTNTADNKAALSKEASALANEITRIANQTTFAGKKILAGQQENTDTIFSKAATADKSKAGTITLQVGSNKGDTIAFQIDNMKFSIASNRADQNFKLDGGNDAVVDIKNNNIAFLFPKADASLVISHMDKMIADVDGLRSTCQLRCHPKSS